MKKITSVLLIVIIVMFSGINAGAFSTLEQTEITPVAEDIVNEETSTHETEEKKLALKWYNEKSNEYSANYSASIYGVTIEEGVFFRKGEVSSAESPYKNTLIRKFIYEKDAAYVYLPQFPFFYLETNQVNQKADLNKASFTEVYEEDGYYVEEYEDKTTGNTSVFYFVDEELKYYTITIDYMGIIDITAKYEITSYEVDDKDVRLPLLAFNATPIYNFLLLLGVIR